MDIQRNFHITYVPLTIKLLTATIRKISQQWCKLAWTSWFVLKGAKKW